MKPTAVLVETNWVVDVIAPAHLQSPQARNLLSRAQTGEFELYVPAICLTEARETLPRRFAPRFRSDDLRKFVRWAKAENHISPEDAEVMRKGLDQFDGLVTNELSKVPERLNNLAQQNYLNIFPLSETMLERQVYLGSLDLSLKPYDLAVLAAVMVKSEKLQQQGHSWIGFCELDSDLQPWNKKGEPKPILRDLYDQARIKVYGDFLLEDIDELPNTWRV